MTDKSYLHIVNHYENCFEKFGATPRGVDWPNQADQERRFQVMLEITKNHLITNSSATLLDLGCGYGALYDFMRQRNLLECFHYSGIDLSEKMIESAEENYPGVSFEERDILTSKLQPSQFDFVLMNGVLTERTSLSQAAMFDFAKNIIAEAFAACKVGLAFNVMSEHVDWKRDDLFHVPFDELAAFLKEKCSRHFVFRSDYGLYEYTVYLYKNPVV